MTFDGQLVYGRAELDLHFHEHLKSWINLESQPHLRGICFEL